MTTFELLIVGPVVLYGLGWMCIHWVSSYLDDADEYK